MCLRRIAFALLTGCILILTSACTTPLRRASGGFALLHVGVVDLVDGRVLNDQTVTIDGDRIVSVVASGEARISANTRRIEAGGKYVMPGLWDMHVHLWDHDVTPALFLANGVTGVRDMGSDTTASVALREAVRRDALAGPPRIFTAGLILDGPREDPGPNRLIVADAAEAAGAVATLRAQGVDFLKVYHFLSRETYLAIAAAARTRGLAFAGHLPPGVTLDDAIASGQRTVEHLYGMREQILKDDDAFVDAAIRKAAASRIWLTPTLAHYRSVAFRDTPQTPYAPDVHARYLTPAMQTFWDTYMPARVVTAGQAKERAAAFGQFQSVVRRLQEGGVRLLAGSDNGIKYVYPGFGLHDELAQLVAAGLTPLAALRAATIAPAEALGLQQSLGSVRAGMLADLLLLDANPLAGIDNTRRITAVVANGSYLDRAVLDQLLRKAERP